MAMKDISDEQVVRAQYDWWKEDEGRSPRFGYQRLAELTGQPEKVCLRCLQRAINRRYLECGTSERTAWLTEKGARLIGLPPEGS